MMVCFHMKVLCISHLIATLRASVSRKKVDGSDRRLDSMQHNEEKT